MSNLLEERCRREAPSFSSSLLEAIYRSIDESSDKETKMKRRRNFILEDGETLRRTIMIEKWMDTESTNRVPRKSRTYNSTSSSSDSSCGYTFSSSEIMMREREKYGLEFKAKTKSKAMKIYSDLKKVKPPVSPGRRLTNFLNSLFIPKNAKRKSNSRTSIEKSWSVKDATTCPLSSSFSRSCSNNPHSRSSSKRSVRFHPMTHIYEDNLSVTRTPTAKKLADNKICLNELKNKVAFEDEDGNDDDVMSCSSSDLFELENIDTIGIGRMVYTEELPVYGTTNPRTNHAVANQF